MRSRLASLVLLLLCRAGNTAAATPDGSYVLGPDDQVSIRVLSAPEIAEKPVRIDLNGYLALRGQVACRWAHRRGPA